MMDPVVYRALANPQVGHLDPWFTHMMGELQVLLRSVFRTENRITYPVSASGSGAIEASVFNVLEPGDECIVCVNGAFSERMAIIADRTGCAGSVNDEPVSDYKVVCHVRSVPRIRKW